MRRIVLTDGQSFSADALNRSSAFDAEALSAAARLVEDVRVRKDDALRDYTWRFDHAKIDDFRVPQTLVDAAWDAADETLRTALVAAAKNIEDFHRRQMRQSWFYIREDGAYVGAKISPLEAVGIYVPGGRALYPSTVLMNALPARVAGVKRIVLVSPPQKDGSIDAGVLAACKLCGVSEVYSVGGAQAIAALAYGTESIAPVNKITGPGNAYVAAAKKIVSGDVGIDMIAGPSEVCVVADDNADPRLVAIDLMAQAEHDPLASSYLIALSGEFADKVEREQEALLQASPRADITRTSLNDKGLIVVCSSIEQALSAVNIIAPEHLELHFEGAFNCVGAVKNAGAIFVGEWTCEALGDYAAGPNHTLPTGGTAMYASPLSVDDFMKFSSVICYSREAFEHESDTVIRLADHEGLWAHAQSARLRKECMGGVR